VLKLLVCFLLSSFLAKFYYISKVLARQDCTNEISLVFTFYLLTAIFLFLPFVAALAIKDRQRSSKRLSLTQQQKVQQSNAGCDIVEIIR
jgi:hypothetical protein